MIDVKQSIHALSMDLDLTINPGKLISKKNARNHTLQYILQETIIRILYNQNSKTIFNAIN